MPVVSFSGLASGFDTSKLVTQLVDASRQPIRQLQTSQFALESQSKRLATIKTKLDALQTAARTLDSVGEIQASGVSTGNAQVATATNSGSSALGSFNLSVTSLAKAQRNYSDGFSAKDQSGLFGVGSFTMTIGATITSVDVDADDTLTSIAAKINGGGVATAGVVYDGSVYRLQVSGRETGAANAITFDEFGTSALGFANNEVQAAADAAFTIDGFPMTSAGNAINNAIAGVTLNLTGAGATTISINRDPDATTKKLQAFVAAYNDIANAINAEFAFTGAARGADSLAGDSTLRGLQSSLRNVIGRTLSGVADPYNMLTSIGITTNRDGSLAFDSGKLTAALASSPDAVTTLLARNLSGGTDGFMAQLADTIDQYTAASSGTISARITSIAGRVRDVTDQISRQEDRLAKYEDTLRMRFAMLEQLMSNIQSQGAQLTSVLSSIAGQNQQS